MSDADHESQPTPRRFRFSLLSLFILTTICALVAAWFFRPQPVKITFLVYAYFLGETEPGATSLSMETIRQRQAKLIDYALSETVIREALQDQNVRDAAVRLTGNHNEPATWLQQRIKINFLGGGEIMRWSFVVDRRLHSEGVRVLEAIVYTFAHQWGLDNPDQNADSLILESSAVVSPLEQPDFSR